MNKICKYIVFLLGNQQYGAAVDQVRSIERLQVVTEIPGMPSFVKGIINLRGVVTPIVDLKERFNIVSENYNDEAKIVIVKVNNFQVGLFVDSATDVLDLDTTLIDPVPQVPGDVDVTFLKGVAKLEKGLLILLDLERVLNFSELTEVQKVIAE